VTLGTPIVNALLAKTPPQKPGLYQAFVGQAGFRGRTATGFAAIYDQLVDIMGTGFAKLLAEGKRTGLHGMSVRYFQNIEGVVAVEYRFDGETSEDLERLISRA